MSLLSRSCRTITATAFATALLLSPGCKPQTERPAAEPAKPIVIGMLAPLTGNGARFGESQRNGVQLALDAINKSGGIQGRRLELQIEDTKTEPPTALTAFTRLSAREDIVALFGSAASLDVPAYLPRIDAAGIPHLLPVAVLPSITDAGSRFTFRNALNDKVAAQSIATFVVQTLGAKKIGLLIEDSAFGETGLAFAKRCEELGVTPLAVERLKRGDLDLRPQLTKLRSLGATHIQFWGYYAEYALAARQMGELNFKAQLLGNQAPVNTKTIELAGNALEGVLNVCLFVPSSTDTESQQFVSEYQRTYKSTPDTWAAQSYDGMRILAAALRKSDLSRNSIRTAVSETRDFRGITGIISFASNGDAQFKDTHIVTVSGGRWTPYIDKVADTSTKP